MKFDAKYIVVIFLMSGAIFCNNIISHGMPVPIKKQLKKFPEHINGWAGKTYFFSKEIYDMLGVDDSILRNYKNSNGDKISLYVGYYETQKKGEIIHSPKNCMLGSGWEPVDISKIDIDLPEDKINVSMMIIQKGMQKEVVLYWYQSGDRVTANEYIQRLFFIWDSIRYNRTNGAFIRLTSPVINNDIERTVRLEKEFIKAAVPILNEFLP